MVKEQKDKLDKFLDYAYYASLPLALTAGIFHKQIPRSVASMLGGGLEEHPMIGGNVRTSRKQQININQYKRPDPVSNKLMNLMESPTAQSESKLGMLKYAIPATALAGLVYAGMRNPDFFGSLAANSNKMTNFNKSVTMYDLGAKMGEPLFKTMKLKGAGLIDNSEYSDIEQNGKKYIIPSSFEDTTQATLENQYYLKRMIPAAALVGLIAGSFARPYLPTFDINIESLVPHYSTIKKVPRLATYYGEGARKTKNDLLTFDLRNMPTMKP